MTPSLLHIATPAVFSPQGTDHLFPDHNHTLSHGELAQRLADARELKRQGIDTSGTEAAILSAWEQNR